jgi:hypothetical protein
MCDFSLQTAIWRPAKVGDKLTTHYFGAGTRGFSAPEDANMAVCLLPGTELAFARPVMAVRAGLSFWSKVITGQSVAIFRQINKHKPNVHHDALEFPDGKIVLLTMLHEGQEATVLQLPAAPMNVAEEEAQKRVAHSG